MVKKIKLFVLLFISFQFFSCEDKPDKNEVNEANVADIKQNIEEYQGVYHFGESEMETSFILIVTNGKCYAQIQSGSFNEDATDWIWSYKNLKNVSIKGNKFYSNLTNGEFVQSDNGEPGLKVDHSWSAMSADDSSEIGYKTQELTNFYNGDYSDASLKVLTKNDLINTTKSELSIIRNEIFARYGYIFKENGEVGAYFNSQKWYAGQHKNVTQFLTDLEKENIGLIKKHEEDAIDNSREFHLENFPKKWFMLNKESKNNEELVINDWCEAEIEQITIEKNDMGDWKVQVNYGQDTDVFNLLDFKATEKEIKSYHLISGYFVIEKPEYDGGETVNYNFTWNKNNQFCNFFGFYGEPVKMVCEQNKGNYKMVVENCDYLNEGY
jgi:hypothetical protein